VLQPPLGTAPHMSARTPLGYVGCNRVKKTHALHTIYRVLVRMMGCLFPFGPELSCSSCWCVNIRPRPCCPSPDPAWGTAGDTRPPWHPVPSQLAAGREQTKAQQTAAAEVRPSEADLLPGYHRGWQIQVDSDWVWMGSL